MKINKELKNFNVLVNFFSLNRIFIEFFFRERERKRNQTGFIDIDLK